MTELQIIEEQGEIKFAKAIIDPEYRKKWNIRQDDFICLTRNGKLIRDTLYREGGIRKEQGNYYLLMKHVESMYQDHITTDSDKKLHLAIFWCILDKQGNEKVICKEFECAHIVKNSIIYSLNSSYFNIETGEFYCKASNYMESENYLFLDNKFDEDKSKRGVLKINKKDGSKELLK